MHRSLMLVVLSLGVSALALGGPIEPQNQAPKALTMVPSIGLQLSEPRPLASSFHGPSLRAAALANGGWEASALASADFDEDGMPDLLILHSGAEGAGTIAIHRGNVDAVYPNEPEAKKRRANGTFVDAPFLPDVKVFDTPEGGDLVGAGDFDADGHRDAVVARRGGTSLWWHRGDGKGSLGEATRVPVPGPIAALAVGDVNRRDGFEDIVVAVEVAASGRLMVFEGLTGALVSAPEEIALAGRANAIALGRLDEDAFADLAVASGKNLEVIRGRDRGLYLDADRRGQVAPAAVLRVPLPFTLESLAIGDFDGKRGSEIALLDSSRRLAILETPDLFADASAAVARLAPVPVESAGAAGDPWRARLVRARVSASPGDDLLLMQKARSGVLARHPAGEGAARSLPLVRDLGAAKEALAMRLGPAALDGLVLLFERETLPRVMDIGPLAVFTVRNTNDSGPDSLRDAILLANMTAELDTIQFDISPGPGPYTITLTTPLPDVMHPTIIDGTSEPDYVSIPIVRLDGHLLTSNILRIRGGGSTIKGLSLGQQGGDSAQAGIYLSDAGNNTVEKNFIGTNTAGTAPGPTFGHGILVTSFGNTIGGTVDAARNIISGNDSVGILAQVDADATVVRGNYIGLDVAGNASVPNGNGVSLDQVTTCEIGGTDAGSRNVISNPNYGVIIGNDATGTLVQDNYIGTDSTGMASFDLAGNGIAIWSTSYVTVGTFGGSGRNVIGGHSISGIEIRDTAGPSQYSNIVGNYIGVAVDGVTPLANLRGIRVDAGPDNFIGGSLSSGRNVISGNGTGVLLAGPGGNHIQGNYIGLNANGLVAVPNGAGVDVTSPGNRIGGPLAGDGNIISGNNGPGVLIAGFSALDNVVQRNWIGTDRTGLAAVGNNRGIDVTGRGTTTIGGTMGTGNLVSGNTNEGILVGLGTGLAEIKGNLIGTNSAGTAALPNGVGIRVETDSCLIGGALPAERNVISGNTGDGIDIRALGIDVSGNYIGTRVDGGILGNGGNGVRVEGPFSVNPLDFIRIGDPDFLLPNTIAFNGGAGVAVIAGSPVKIRDNEMYSNGGLGIDLGGDGVTLNDLPIDGDAGPNGLQNFPVVNMARSTGTVLTVSGTLITTPDLEFTIDFYINGVCDPLGYGEGATHIGSTPPITTDATGLGAFSLTITGAFDAGDIVTATATAEARTSEFSACQTVAGAGPGPIPGVRFESNDTLVWDPTPDATAYHVYAGTPATLPGLATQAADSCEVAVLTETSGTLPAGAAPPPGQMFWFLVTAEGPYGEGPLAPGNPGPRVLTSTGICGDSCAHDQCVVGAALVPACTPQAAFVCGADPKCCDPVAGAWDFKCVQEVRTVGRSLACPESQGQCPHDLCCAGCGEPLPPGCDSPPLPVSCTALVCQADPHCCQLTWDDACIAKMVSLCGYNCT